MKTRLTFELWLKETHGLDIVDICGTHTEKLADLQYADYIYFCNSGRIIDLKEYLKIEIKQ